ncbi:winged helix-turn-helix domain-containing protein [uncultured Pseudoflavonifractor sp.]|uniref:ArsR/SmtB family transcription factor n=1 Tax=uncultured Pseudoflavonifractor sp. TaxID=1221379 RepID=UPI0025E186B7|nr:winged helix-turn-helix domain-containing protein [uncultured Pseudoflavonifractor sp.]
MLIRAFPGPYMLLEAVELLYAVVNRVPAQKLTSGGSYELPVEEMQHMIDGLEREMDLQNPDLKLFFQKIKIKDGSEDTTCLARSIAYLKMDFACTDVTSAMLSLQDKWREMQRGCEYPVHIGKYNLDCDKCDDKRTSSLEQKIRRLLVPAEYQRELLNALTDFQTYTERLQKLLLPAAEYMERRLAPWIERAQPLLKRWEEQFTQPESLAKIARHWPKEVAHEAENLYFTLRYLDCQYRVSQYDAGQKSVYLHIGVGCLPEDDSRNGVASWELRALRLLGNAARAQILFALRDKPMSTREIARELQMDLGTVSRDVRNLCDAGVLVTREGEDRRRYSICTETVEALIAYLEMLKSI